LACVPSLASAASAPVTVIAAGTTGVCGTSATSRATLSPVRSLARTSALSVRRCGLATIESRRQRDRWLDLHNHGVPGISNSDILTFEAAATKTLRVNILPKKFFRRYAKTKFRVLLGVERTPPYHRSVDSGQVITVVR
jgi:hypothetical protein